MIKWCVAGNSEENSKEAAVHDFKYVKPVTRKFVTYFCSLMLTLFNVPLFTHSLFDDHSTMSYMLARTSLQQPHNIHRH